MNIYVISNPNDNRNLVKVGQTNDWTKREKAYKTGGFTPQVLHLEYNVDITDDDVKRVLVNDLHYQIEKSAGDEWYIVPDGETEKQFANKVKSVIVSLKHNEPLDLLRTQDFAPRTEQQRCVDETIAAFNAGADKFLWNCKMRFGKTFTTYQLMRQAKLQNILVLTWKVAVESGWKEDLLAHRDFKGINFVNKDALGTFDKTKRNVVFLSIPLLLANTEKEAKGAEDSEGDDKEISDTNITKFADKIQPIADMDWDLLVIDEAHYGVRAKNTAKILEKIKYKKKLELSGTPFKILDDAEYHRDEIYNWTYKQEQEAKHGWKGPKEQNPYKDLPDMHIYTFDGARDMTNDFEDTEFKINVLFKTKKDRDPETNKLDNTTAEFINIDSVKRMVNFMCGEQFDLVEDKDIKEHDVILPYYSDMVEKNKKSIWFLPDVAAVCAMERLLNNHKFFKNYKIINASGDGEGSSAKSLDAFKNAEQSTDKIICLSCGMLNTGVTIKPLNSVVMLQDKHSAQDFYQSIFRCQSPCPPDKTDCYVFDFNPKRYFNNMLEFSKANTGNKNPREALEENLIETHLYIDGTMNITTYDDIMNYVSLDLNPERLKKAFLKSNNIKVELLEHSSDDILDIIDSIPYYKKENKTTEKKDKKAGTGKKKNNKKPPIDPKRKQESKFDIRKAKLDILISSLTIFIYITNAQESNVYEIITTKEPDLFNKICFIGVEQFKKLYNFKDKDGNNFFKTNILDKAIARFKREEYVSRDWEEILRDEFGLPKIVATKKINPSDFSFDEIGLNAGAELVFTLEPNKKCYVASDLRSITHQARPYSIYSFVKTFGKPFNIVDWETNAPAYFTYRGVKLSQMIDDINAKVPNDE